MMKQLFTLIAFLGFCSVLQAKDFYGNTHLKEQKFDNITVFGPAEFSKVHADSVTIKGPFAFNDLSVQGKLEAFGPTEGKNSEIGEVVAAGPLQLEHCKINTFDVAGPFRAKYIIVSKASSFSGPFAVLDSQLQDVTITSDKAIFADSKVNNIMMKKNADINEQVILLEGKTIVSGDINFESGKGKVFAEGSAKIKGKVIGGTLITSKQ